MGVRNYIGGLRHGRSGTRRLDLPDADRSRLQSTVAALCPAFDPLSVLPAAELRRVPRLVPMALAATTEALEDAGLTNPDARASAGLLLGTGAGGIDFTLDQAQIAYDDASQRGISLWTITNATHGNLAGELSIHLGLKGPSLCVSTGCASSSDAIGHAMDLLRSDRPGAPDIMVVVGADAHVRWETLRGMELLRCISTRDFSDRDAEPATASRPFDATRDGFVLGEGAWALVLERASHARARGAACLGEALGYAATCDAYHRVRPAPDT
ncbi:MAG: beta-ketoacyl synthase N-terminal-like domain-containing protein, partial [Planctomycetota bacterium]